MRLPNDKILDWFKLEAFGDGKLKMEQKINFCFGKGLPAFSPFQKTNLLGWLKVGIVW